MLFFLVSLYFVGTLGEKYTLPGNCPYMKLQQNLDHDKFTGVWYHAGGYVSDDGHINDCAAFDFQKDNEGFTLKETYVDGDEGNRTQKWYTVKLNPIYKPEDRAQFLTSYEYKGQVVKIPLTVLSTDYDKYAILYVCKEDDSKHSVVTWILTRNKGKLRGNTFLKVGDELAKYTELVENKEEFRLKLFNDGICAFNMKVEINFLDSNIC